MVLPEPFTTASPIIASFDYTDIVEGTGVLRLQGYKSTDSTGVDYRLSRETLITTAVETSSAATVVSGNPQTHVKVLDLDFDLGEFNMAKNVTGTLNICTSLAVKQTAGAGSVIGYAIYKLRKYDGTTETEISSVQSQSLTAPPGGTAIAQISLSMDVSLEHFNAGDILRLTIEGWLYYYFAETASSTGIVTIPHDPTNTDGTIITPATTYTTKLDVYTPFRYE